MNQKAFLAVLCSATIAGASGVFIKNVSMPATSIAFVRTALPTLLLGSFLLISGTRLFRGNYKLMLGGSLFNVMRIYLYFIAYIYTSISKAVIIQFSWPIFVTIFSIIFLKEVVSRRNLFLLLLSFIGLIIVFGKQEFTFDNKDLVGMMAALGVAVTYAVTVVIFKKGTEEFSSPEIIFYQNLIGMLVFFPFIMFTDPPPLLRDIGIISIYAVLMGIIGFMFFFYGLKHLKASTASMLAYIEIVSTFLFGFFLLNETITWNMLLGGGIIIMTTALLRR